MSLYNTPEDLLSGLPDRVAAEIRTILPGLRTCRGMAGRLDVKTIKALGIAAPAVLVTRLRLRQDQTRSGPHHTFRAQMAAFILCKDELALPRDVGVSNIAQVLLTRLPDTDWGAPDHLGPAEAMTEEPLVSAESQGLAMALTAITWDQVIAFEPWPEPPSITPTLYLGQAPAIGADHEADYTLIGGGQ
ncbi:hypothetical protein [Gemmobacter serpentinus]|uniref:hypothetical protein n=1 Tax=Gemmobacter serpentinus TaxID=2652247 RepID=UPI00124E0C1C|nr:hypothetical protein [Gemmobacter serpentinus]